MIDDETLMDELRRIANVVDGVPASVVHAARETFTWRSVDAELAELLADSALDAGVALVRGDTGPRSLSFAGGKLIVELEVIAEGERRTLVGQLAPAGAAVVEVQTAEERSTVDADAHGRFRADLVPAGRMRLRVSGHPDLDGPVETSWVTI